LAYYTHTLDIVKKVAISARDGYNEAKRKIIMGAWKSSTMQCFRASGAIFAGGFLGMLYGALAGLVFANILLPIMGTPYGLVSGAIGGCFAGLVGVSLGGWVGYGLGGLLGGMACMAAWYTIIGWWVLIPVVAISTALGIKIGSEIDREVSRWFLIDWLRDEIGCSCLGSYRIWQRCIFGCGVFAVTLLPLLLLGWNRLH